MDSCEISQSQYDVLKKGWMEDVGRPDVKAASVSYTGILNKLTSSWYAVRPYLAHLGLEEGDLLIRSDDM